MVSTLKSITALSIYFSLLFIVVSLFSIAGMDNDLVVNENFKHNTFYNGSSPNTYGTLQDSGTSFFSFSDYFTDVFSFFAWDIHAKDGYDDDKEIFGYFWILRIFLVYIPLLVLILSVWYSFPTINQ